MSRARTAILGVLAAGVVTLSCQLILGVDQPVGADRVDPTTMDTDSGDPCAHTRPPDLPAMDSDTKTKNVYWMALEEVILPLHPDAGAQPGFDLDNSCTCQPDLKDGAAPCKTPGTPSTFCDFDGGVDDALGSVTSRFSLLPGFNPAQPINSQFEGGSRTLLFYINDYNGLANDTDVGVAFVPSGGLYTNAGCDNLPRANAQVVYTEYPDGGIHLRYVPLRDGCDQWSAIPSATKLVPDAPDLVSRHAALFTVPGYVSNFTVVVKSRELSFALLEGAARVSNGITVAKLTKVTDRTFRAEGIVTGRMGFDDVVQLVGTNRAGSLPDGGDRFVCESSFWNAPLFANLCSARDTMASPSEEFQGKVCDSATATLGFRAGPALVADEEYENPMKPVRCTSAGINCTAP